LDTIEKNKEAERIKSRRDLEEVAFEAIRDFNKRRKGPKNWNYIKIKIINKYFYI